MKMDEQEAIEYLQEKELIKGPVEKKERINLSEESRKFFDKNDQKEIKKVMKEGKIYGDPVVILGR